MIEIKETYQLSTGTAPYTGTITADDTCANFTPSNFTTDDNGVFSVTFTFPDEACITGTTFTATGTDASGCSFSLGLTVDNICSSFNVSEIGNPDLFEFTVGAGSQSSGSFSFIWDFDTVKFEQISKVNQNNNSTIKLKLKNSNSVPSSSTISVRVTDGNGCTETKTLTFVPCVPKAQDITVHMYPVTTPLGTIYTSAPVTIPTPSNCAGYTFDIDDNASVSVPSGFGAQVINSALSLTFTGTPANDTYLGTYTILSDEGVSTDSARINIIVHKSTTTETISTPDINYTLDCSVNPGDVVEINIEDQLVVQDGASIDWSSWKLITSSSQDNPVSDSIVLGTNSSGKYVIKYTAPNPIVADIFRWIICDTDGNCTKAVTYTVSQCAEAPTANDDAATVACGETVTIDLLQNDDAAGSELRGSTVVIENAPKHGTVIVNDQGVASYVADTLYNGSDTFQYSVENSYGTRSNTATVTVTIICAGADTEVALCN